MAWGLAALAGVGGALRGVNDERRWQDEYAQKERLAKQAAEERAHEAEVRASTAELVQFLKNNGLLANTGAKTEGDLKVVGAKTEGALQVQGSKNEGATAVQGLRNEGAAAVEGVRSTDRARALDSSNALNWDKNRIAEELGYGRIATTERGQNIGASTTRRGQDMSASTAAAGRVTTERGQTLADQRGREGLRLRSLNSLFGPDGTPGTPPDESLPPPPPSPSGLLPGPAMPVTPPSAPTRAPLPVRPRSQSNAVPGADPRLALATQLVALTKQITAMPAGPAREAAKKQLATLRQQAQALRTSSPPGQD